MNTEFEIVAKQTGTLGELLDTPRPAIPYDLPTVLQCMASLAFIVETVAHLQGKESQLLPEAQKARKVVAAFEVK